MHAMSMKDHATNIYIILSFFQGHTVCVCVCVCVCVRARVCVCDFPGPCKEHGLGVQNPPDLPSVFSPN